MNHAEICRTTGKTLMKDIRKHLIINKYFFPFWIERLINLCIKIICSHVHFCFYSSHPISEVSSSGFQQNTCCCLSVFSYPSRLQNSFPTLFLQNHPIIAAPNTSRHSVQTPSEQAKETGNLSVDLQGIVSAQVQVRAAVEKGVQLKKKF